MTNKKITTLLALAVTAGLMTGCASKPAARLSSIDQYSQRVQLYLHDGDLRSAESTLAEMDLYYPRSSGTQAMQMKMIGVYYKAAEMDRAVTAANRYIATFPAASDIDEAYYYSGMANYDRGLRYLAEKGYEKSPLHARASRESFAALLRCCYGSRFIVESGERLAFLDERLAQYEYGLMRTDLLLGDRAAAEEKGRLILSSYPATSAAGVAEVVLSSLDKPELLDRLLITTALTLNPEEVADIAARAEAAEKPAAIPAVAAADREPVLPHEDLAPDAVEPAAAMAPVDLAALPRKDAGGAAVPEARSFIAAAPSEPIARAGLAAETPVQIPAKTPEKVKEEKAPAPLAPIAPALAPATVRYTVQMGSNHSLAALQGYMRRLGLGDAVSYEPRTVNGMQRHSAYYGAYESRGAAQRSANELMAKLGVQDLWVRPLSGVPAEPRDMAAVTEGGKARPAAAVAKARPDGRYAVQVASSPNLDQLRAHIRRMKLEGEVQYHQRTLGNQTVYSALYGGYGTLSAARDGMSQLQQRTQQHDLWIRPVSESRPVTALMANGDGGQE